MREGTKKLFPDDYQRFKDTMISASRDGELPVELQLDDIGDYTLKDFQDAFSDFKTDTGLDMNGSLYLCRDCGKLHFILEVSCEKAEEHRILQ